MQAEQTQAPADQTFEERVEAVLKKHGLIPAPSAEQIAAAAIKHLTRGLSRRP